MSRYPAIVEDIAVVVGEAMPVAEVEGLIRQTSDPRLVEARLFDLFRSEQVGAGKKSLAYRLTYQSAEGTLTDRDAEKIRNRVVKRLERELGAVLRG